MKKINNQKLTIRQFEQIVNSLLRDHDSTIANWLVHRPVRKQPSKSKAKRLDHDSGISAVA